MKRNDAPTSPPSKRGARPGERRGGKAVGTRDKATLDREKRLNDAIKAAIAAVGDDKIWAMSMLDIMEFASRLAFANGWVFKAAEIADKAAPYRHAKLASTVIDDKRRRAPEQFGDDELFALYGVKEEAEQRAN